MRNTNCLIITEGFFGDIIFASSLAGKLKKDYNEVDYLIGFSQMEILMKNNPYINNVYVSNPNSSSPIFNIQKEYTQIIKLPKLSFNEPPPVEYQQYCNIKEFTPEYHVYTSPEYDAIAKDYIDSISNGKKVLAYMANWKEKTYLFTEEQYELGIDVPNLGYGGKHRDINFILNQLKEDYTLLEIGFPNNINQFQTSEIEYNHPKSILFECSLMKYCDAFIGTEGGLSNLAAGVGCKTIITGDFIHQLYGWNGVIKKIKEPKLGPKYYFGDNHITLDPYLTDEQIVIEIKNKIK
jgi:hypothetical protein